MSKAGPNSLQLPEHLRNMLPDVVARDPTTSTVFLAESLKPKATGKHTSTRQMTATGVWSERDTREASAAQGRAQAEGFVSAAVQFIDRWKVLRPLQPRSERQVSNSQ